MTPDSALVVVAIFSVVAVTLALLYFHRYDSMRPPLGTMNIRDVVFALVAIAVMPYVYLALPVWAVAIVIGGLWLSLLLMFFRPVITGRRDRWIVAAGLVCADVIAVEWLGPSSGAFRLINNALVVLIAAAIANLWAQSGLRARDLSVLALGLMIYDPIATSHLTLMTDLLTHFRTSPFQPSIVWGTGNGQLGIGFGDITLSALLSLVLIKAFGARLAIAGAVTVSAVLAVGLSLFQSNVIHVRAFPAMVIIGPIILIFCAVGRFSHGRERTTFEYRQSLAKPTDLALSDSIAGLHFDQILERR